MKKYFLSSLFLLSSLPAAADTIPSSWEAHWKGECRSTNNFPSPRMKMSLKFERLEDKRWTWHLKYGSSATRRYALVLIDEKLGTYGVDEGLGLVLESTYDRVHGLSGIFSANVQGKVEAVMSEIILNEKTDKMHYKLSTFHEAPFDTGGFIVEIRKFVYSLNCVLSRG